MTTAITKRKFYGNQYAGPCDECGWVIRYAESAHPEYTLCSECNMFLCEKEYGHIRLTTTVLPTYDQARHYMEPWELAFPGLTRK